MRITTLDSIRVAALLGVLVGHSPLGGGIIGGFGVAMFFVLSGYLVTRQLLGEYDRTGGIAREGFWQRRAVRLLPAYLAYLTFAAGVDLLRGDPWPLAQSIGAATFTTNYFNAANGHPSSSIAHIWSLALEQQFYLVWPVLLLAARARGMLALRRALWVAIAGVVAWRTIAFTLLDLPLAYLWNAFETRVDALLIGGLLVVHAGAAAFVRIADAAARRTWLPLLTLAAIAASRTALPWAAWQATLGFTLTAALAAVLVLQLIGIAAVDGPRAWGHGAVQRLGRWTYGAFLWHPFALGAGVRLPIPLVLQVAAAVVLAFVAGACSHYFVERPVATWWAARAQTLAAARIPAPAPLEPPPRQRSSGAVVVADFVARYIRRAA